MYKKPAFYIILLLISAAIFASCNKEERDATAKQEDAIEKYINSRFADNEIVRNNGSNRIIIEKKEGDSTILEKGDTLCFYYAGFVFSNGPSALFATNLETVAQTNNFTLTDPDFNIAKIAYSKKNFIEGLYNGLDGISEGEHALILFSAKYGFGNNTVYNIPKFSALIYEIWTEQIIKTER